MNSHSASIISISTKKTSYYSVHAFRVIFSGLLVYTLFSKKIFINAAIIFFNHKFWIVQT